MCCCKSVKLLTPDEIRLNIGSFSCEEYGKCYFINIFNERALKSVRFGDQFEVLMEDYLYYIISDCYNDVKSTFILNGYRWKHYHEIGCIKITWK